MTVAAVLENGRGKPLNVCGHFTHNPYAAGGSPTFQREILKNVTLSTPQGMIHVIKKKKKVKIKGFGLDISYLA